MKHIVAYTAALTLAIAIIFGAFKAEAHDNDGAAIAGAAIGFGLGLAAGVHSRRYHRDYFPTGPAYYPHNYYIPGYTFYPAYEHPYFRHSRKALRYRYNRRHH